MQLTSTFCLSSPLPLFGTWNNSPKVLASNALDSVLTASEMDLTPYTRKGCKGLEGATEGFLEGSDGYSTLRSLKVGTFVVKGLRFNGDLAGVLQDEMLINR